MDTKYLFYITLVISIIVQIITGIIEIGTLFTPFLISNAHFTGQKIRKNVKSIVGISPTMVLLFPVLLL
jgi:hypothetical protein